MAACSTICALATMGDASASAMAPAPGWAIMGQVIPTVAVPGKQASIDLTVMNVGGATASSGAVVTDTLPPQLEPTGGSSIFRGVTPSGSCTVSGQTVTCALDEGEFAAGGVPKDTGADINIGVQVNAEASGVVTDRATISGGGALEAASTEIPISFGTSPAAAGFAHLWTYVTNANGTPDTQAGSHPYEFLTGYAVNSEVGEDASLEPSATFGESTVPAAGQARDLNYNAPPGFIGDAQAAPKCPRADLVTGLGGGCPADTQIGVNRATAQGLQLATNDPIYNMVPPPGLAAQFAFDQGGNTVFFNAGVRSGGDNGITEHVPDVIEKDITFDTTELWGAPGEASRVNERAGGKSGESQSEVPFLTMPTSCGHTLEPSMEMLSLWEPEVPFGSSAITAPFIDSEEAPITTTGCALLQPFAPSISIEPDTTHADTPAGLIVNVKMPQGQNPEGLQTPGLKDTTVVLPEGVVINPGQATGLLACKPSQEALGLAANGEVEEGPVSCPSASKVGTDEIESPLLPGKLQGNVYILEKNPPNLQLLIAASGYGVNLKLVGNVHLNESTGQLTTTFENTPDFPFTEFRLAFSGGAQAALATPAKCGVYESSADFTPWSTPAIEDALDSSRFQIDSGPGGSPCVWPMPFAPTLEAGATTDQAGGYTGFTMMLKREDEQQRIGTLQFKTPPGLLGMISHVTLCEEPQAASGSCPAGSQIGHTVATSGPGPYPFEVPQAGGPPAPIYITGPYDGAPYGLSIVVPVVAGPFNLGTVIVRAKIEVDPRTSQLRITTTDLPRILDGIPTDIREVVADIDRPQFMFNPTDCNASAFTGTATSLEGASAPLSSRFRVGSCRSLSFSPTMTAQTKAKHTRRDGDSLTVKVTYPSTAEPGQATSQANIAKVRVELPKALPVQSETLHKACLYTQFEANPAGCPADSVVGTATVHTPVLPQELKGPAYFVSYGGAQFPELVVVLQGGGVTVQLNGETFISKNGVTSSTFNALPDVPFSSFELTLPAGEHPALAAYGNFCKKALEMPTTLTGQNGAVIKENIKIGVVGCKASKSVKKHKKHTKHQAHKKGAHAKK